MINWAQMLKKVHQMIGEQLAAATAGKPLPYGYLYGGDGRKATEKYIRDIVKKYRKVHFDKLFKDTGKTEDDLVAWLVGKYVYDCSQFVVAASNAPNDMDSTHLINACTLITPPAGGVAGSVLYKQGHVSIDLGGGMCADFGNEFLDLRVYPIAQGNFVKSGQLPWVNYYGSSNL